MDLVLEFHCQTASLIRDKTRRQAALKRPRRQRRNEATESLAAAQETSTDAAVASELDGIFKFRGEQTSALTEIFNFSKKFLLDSQLAYVNVGPVFQTGATNSIKNGLVETQ